MRLPGPGEHPGTSDDSFDFGMERGDMERMMRRGRPMVFTGEGDQQPFLATSKGQNMLIGSVVAAYWGAPFALAIKRRRQRRRKQQ